MMLSHRWTLAAAALAIWGVAEAVAQSPDPAAGPLAPLAVYDANGKLVGRLTQDGEVLVSLESGRQFKISVNAAGFGPGNGLGIDQIAFSHLTTDCSGQRYFDATILPAPTIIYRGTVIFAGNPVAKRRLRSQEVFSSSQPNISQPGTCQQIDVTGYVGPLASRLVSNIGNFVPPFAVR